MARALWVALIGRVNGRETKGKISVGPFLESVHTAIFLLKIRVEAPAFAWEAVGLSGVGSHTVHRC